MVIKKKTSKNLKFFMFLILILLIISFLLLLNPNNLNKPQSTTTSSTTTTTTSIPVTPQTKSLTREVFLDVKSGEGLLWFSNATVNDVRTAMRIWEEKTNQMIKFEEIRGESAADIVIKFSGSFNESTAGMKTTGEAYVYLGQIRGKIYMLPSDLSCRNQVRAIHEIGHIIGLNHSSVYMSAMHPTESCVQNITDEDAAQAIELISQFV